MHQTFNLSPLLNKIKSDTIASGVSVHYLSATEKETLPFTVTMFEVMPGCTTPLDQHTVEELWIVVTGSGLLTKNNTSFNITQGDSIYFPSQAPHLVLNTSNLPLRIYSIYW